MRHALFTCVSLLLAALSSMACEGERSRALTSETSDHAIIGGTPSGVDDSANVALRIVRQDGQEGLCSGVVVAPRVVLTAAHCVAPQAVGSGAIFSLTVDGIADEVAVDSVAFDPDFDLALIARGHDIGVAITAEPLPVTPVDFAVQPELASVDTLRVVGYGISSTMEENTEGVRRQAHVPMESFDELFIIMGQGAAPCLGDSGGAVFAELGDGSEALVGIVSFTDNACGAGTKATHLASYQNFVWEQVELAESSDESPGGCGVAAGQGRGALLLLALLAAFRRKRAGVTTLRR